uniref:Uncharacterized protein n=1 Tax=Arundo donax TaxID=35708 RepID=A0A0A9BKL6_ARUDO
MPESIEHLLVIEDGKRTNVRDHPFFSQFSSSSHEILNQTKIDKSNMAYMKLYIY